MALRVNIDAPLPLPPLSGLIEQSQVQPFGAREERGVTIVPHARPTIQVVAPTSRGPLPAAYAPAATRDADPFDALVGIDATSLGFGGFGSPAGIRQELQRVFEAYEHVAVEREFEQGTLFPANPVLAGLPDATPTPGTGLGVVAAVGLLEARLWGRGVLHATPAMATLLARENLVDSDRQGRLVTRARGSAVVVGDGYQGLGPAALRTARLTTALAGANNDLAYTAVAPGTGGNSTTVTYADPGGNNAALSVTVAGQAITVHLATGAGGAITSTASDVLAAVQASAAASALVSVALAPSNTGAGVVTALASTPLAGGTAGPAAGNQYLYATGPIVLRRDAATRLEPSSDTDAFNPTTNRVVVYAQRRYLVTPNLDGAAAVLVDGDASDVAGMFTT